jgi:hypothetical protein
MRQRRKLEILTNSRFKAFRACKRKHHLRYERGIRPVKEDEDLRFGSLVHALLEHFWLSLLFGTARADGSVLDRLDEITAEIAATDPFDREKAYALLDAYAQHWRDDGLVPIAVEAEFFCPLRNPDSGQVSRVWMLGGKLDVVVRKLSGALALMEHKTSSEDISQGSMYWRRRRMDGQVSIYFAGARALGYDVEECIFDVIGKPPLRPLKATPPEARRFTKDGRLDARQRLEDETPEQYGARCAEWITENEHKCFVREPIVRLERELLENERDLWQEAKTMRDAEISGRNPRNVDACDLYRKTCEFFEVCSGGASADDTALFKIASNPHAELSSIPEEGRHDAAAAE